MLAVSPSANLLSGITNPTTCLDYGSSVMFVVDNDNYPEYDESNLYNSNPDFDSGPFRDLHERHALMNTNSTLFAFKFNSPGVYVFRSSKYPDYKMVCLLMYCIYNKLITNCHGRLPFGSTLRSKHRIRNHN